MRKIVFRPFFSGTNNLDVKCKEYITVKRFSQQEVDEFSKLTGDFNPIHSTRTSLDQRKVHGAFLNAVVSGILGTHMPGPGTIVLEQSFKFPKACRVDIDTEIQVRLIKARKISLAEYVCRQHGDIVLTGEAKLLTKINN